MASLVLDASALLALLNRERGYEAWVEALPQAVMSAVNLSEVAAKLVELGITEAEAREMIEPLGLEVVDFDEALAWRAARLRPATRSAGLSLGDRACLALAAALDLPALTTDRAWQGVDSGVEVRLMRGSGRGS